jgi:hypothetical protein
MTDMKRQAIPLVLLILLFVVPVTGSPTGYSQDLFPRDSVSTRITWTVVESPEVAFTLWFSGTGAWIATPGSEIVFEITSVSEDVEGQLTLGNVTYAADDTDIAIDLALGAWSQTTPWLPGFVVKIGASSFADLNETAFASAKRVLGNNMNGTMVSTYEVVTSNGIQYDCIVFEYVQDPIIWGEPQLTTLAYDLETGILVKANTSYSFGTPYLLVFELARVDIPTVDPFFLWVGVTVAGVVLIIVAAVIRRR